MCRYCERNQSVKHGWAQPPLCDEGWKHPSDTIKDSISSNLNINGEPDWEARIHDYQTATPELILTSVNMAAALWGGGTASVYVPIKYCPVCGRRLGKKPELQKLAGLTDEERSDPDMVKSYCRHGIYNEETSQCLEEGDSVSELVYYEDGCEITAYNAEISSISSDEATLCFEDGEDVTIRIEDIKSWE